MTCLVFGASGQIGHFLLPRLCAAERSVMAVSRVSRESQAGVMWVRGCLPDAAPALPDDLDAIVCLGPLDHFSHWLQQAPVTGSPRIVAMSSMSAESKRESPVGSSANCLRVCVHPKRVCWRGAMRSAAPALFCVPRLFTVGSAAAWKG